jgi:uncharacterized OB-fold protein
MSSLVRMINDPEVGKIAQIKCPKCGQLFHDKYPASVETRYLRHRIAKHNGDESRTE